VWDVVESCYHKFKNFQMDGENPEKAQSGWLVLIPGYHSNELSPLVKRKTCNRSRMSDQSFVSNKECLSLE
jgi:hypothetical protein